MSRIGKLPIKIPTDVHINYTGSEIIVKGKFGILQNMIPHELAIKQEDGTLIVSLKNESKKNRALHGLYRTLINNMVIGVSEQFKIPLNLVGVGYRAVVEGKNLVLNLGYSHQVNMEIPLGILVEVSKNTTLNLKGCNKEELGLFAAKIRSWRPPEPYKGKGILYENERVLRKAGKSGKK
jgi:large subunit ribosomal protein L6